MEPFFAQVLRCPIHPDAGPQQVVDAPSGAGLKCPHCGRVYPVRDGVADMLVGEAVGEFREREMEQWDRQAAHYDEGRLKDPIYMAAVESAARTLRPCAGDLVLDAGCGTGLTIRQYYRPGMRVVALDLSLESLRYLRKVCPGATIYPVRADLTALPFPADVFDRVLCANALQQFPEEAARRQCVRELARVAAAGAPVVVTVQNLSVPKKRAGWRKENKARGPSGAVQYNYRYETAEFRDLLATELHVEKVRGAGLPLWYRWKLGGVSRRLERYVLSGLPASANWGNMLVGVARKTDESAERKQEGLSPTSPAIAGSSPGRTPRSGC
jgi:ubiquinone/menaquinone biosynthesis C-methylase UbiE/uncharacterized protein YbaR (Trm112 family)